MTKNEIHDSIDYLENIIDKFSMLKGYLETSTNLKERTKYNELLFDKMFDAKNYIKENGIYKFAFQDNERAENVFLTGLTKERYFTSDLKGLITKLRNKLS